MPESRQALAKTPRLHPAEIAAVEQSTPRPRPTETELVQLSFRAPRELRQRRPRPVPDRAGVLAHANKHACLHVCLHACLTTCAGPAPLEAASPDVGRRGPQNEPRRSWLNLGGGVDDPDRGELAEEVRLELTELLVVPAELESERLPRDCGRLAEVAHPVRQPRVNVEPQRRQCR